jgi:hypothetical protein
LFDPHRWYLPSGPDFRILRPLQPNQIRENDKMSTDPSALEAATITDSQARVQAIIGLLQTLEHDELMAVHAELKAMCTVGEAA